MQDIANAWKGLEGCEKSFEEWLLSEMMRYGHELWGRWRGRVDTCLSAPPRATYLVLITIFARLVASIFHSFKKVDETALEFSRAIRWKMLTRAFCRADWSAWNTWPRSSNTNPTFTKAGPTARRSCYRLKWEICLRQHFFFDGCLCVETREND